MRDTRGGQKVTCVSPAAIICSPAMLGEEHAAEQEYVVDRRLLRGVRIIRRYPVETLTAAGTDTAPAGDQGNERL